MDSITHIAVGAVIGEAIMGRKIGKRAMLLGAIAQSLPDIDFVASFFLSTADDLLAHRGFTHSFLFAALASFLLALISERWHRPHNISLQKWILFYGIEVFTHLFLDAFNSYGTGWFEPFSHLRISFNALFVADPFFSVWCGVACIALLILRIDNIKRIYWIRFSLGLSVIYLLYALYNKSTINAAVEKNLAKQHIASQRFFATPTALNNWLWYIVSEDKNGFYIGYRSVFDRDSSIDFHYFPRQQHLLGNVKQKEDIQRLVRFSQGYYTLDHIGDTLVFNDLRFGQIMGWQNPQAGFAFHYYVELSHANDLVIQRGRFTGWNSKTIRALVRRIKGVKGTRYEERGTR